LLPPDVAIVSGAGVLRIDVGIIGAVVVGESETLGRRSTLRDRKWLQAGVELGRFDQLGTVHVERLDRAVGCERAHRGI